jgi:hypothetical protein
MTATAATIMGDRRERPDGGARLVPEHETVARRGHGDRGGNQENGRDSEEPQDSAQQIVVLQFALRGSRKPGFTGGEARKGLI